MANIPHPGALEFILGDGNADKEAEKLIPSPNFCVHTIVCSKESQHRRVGFYIQPLCNIFPPWSKTRAKARAVRVNDSSFHRL